MEQALAIARERRTALEMEAERCIDETGATSLTPLVLLDHAELAGLEDDIGARCCIHLERSRAFEERKPVIPSLSPLACREILNGPSGSPGECCIRGPPAVGSKR